MHDVAWRRQIAERLRVVASQVESGNVATVICISQCGGMWVQDIRYADQYESIGALELTKLTLMMGKVE